MYDGSFSEICCEPRPRARRGPVRKVSKYRDIYVREKLTGVPLHSNELCCESLPVCVSIRRSSFAAAVGSTLDSLGKGCTLLFRDPKVLLVGLVSACFEAAMYAFVFEWTPAVSGPPGSPKPPYGEIFSVMMLCCTGGTRVFSAIVGRGHTSPSQLLAPTCWLSALALAAPFAALTLTAGAPLPTLAAFLLFEGCVGAYFPAMGTLKSITVPDAQRSTVIRDPRQGERRTQSTLLGSKNESVFQSTISHKAPSRAKRGSLSLSLSLSLSVGLLALPHPAQLVGADSAAFPHADAPRLRRLRRAPPLRRHDAARARRQTRLARNSACHPICAPLKKAYIERVNSRRNTATRRARSKSLFSFLTERENL